LVVYLLLAAILTFGQILYSAQTVQQVADVAAREISRTPLSATADLMDVLYSNDSQFAGVRTAVFNPQLLQYDLSTLAPGQSILDQVRTWPIVNQMLYPLMVPIIPPGATQAQWLSYPGVVPCTDGGGRTVYCVAQVNSAATGGTETVSWVPVIEEITPGAFSVASSQGGLVSLRVNIGCGSASMSAFPPQTSWPPAPTGPAIVASDDPVTGSYTPTGTPLQSQSTTYNGNQGLGTQQAWGATVRPYRRLISAQAIFRREVFQ
jgi:hypothetical protein